MKDSESQPVERGAPAPNSSLAAGEFLAEFRRALTAIAPAGLELHARHAWAVVERNRVMNLTRLTDPGDMARRHVLDSLVARRLLPTTGEGGSPITLLDAGSGAGWPGLALAIEDPALRVTLLDSTRKKVDFLQEVVADLGLDDRVTCRWGRLDRALAGEDPAPDVVTARALGSVGRIVEWCPREFAGGLLLWKGPRADAELRTARRALRQRSLEVVADLPYALPGESPSSSAPSARRLLLIAPKSFRVPEVLPAPDGRGS